MHSTQLQGRRQGFRPGWAKFGAKRRKKIFVCPPWFQFAHPAIRNGCPPCPPYRGGFKGKGVGPLIKRAPSPPLPSVWPSLTLRPSYTHAWSMTTEKNGNISTLSCVTEVYHVYHHQVHHIHRVTHSHCNRAIDTLSESSQVHVSIKCVSVMS